MSSVVPDASTTSSEPRIGTISHAANHGPAIAHSTGTFLNVSYNYHFPNLLDINQIDHDLISRKPSQAERSPTNLNAANPAAIPPSFNPASQIPGITTDYFPSAGPNHNETDVPSSEMLQDYIETLSKRFQEITATQREDCDELHSGTGLDSPLSTDILEQELGKMSKPMLDYMISLVGNREVLIDWLKEIYLLRMPSGGGGSNVVSLPDEDMQSLSLRMQQYIAAMDVPRAIENRASLSSTTSVATCTKAARTKKKGTVFHSHLSRNSPKCVLEATTCWVSAEHALNHAKSKISEVSEAFKTWNIQESEYIVQAGFDESLIKSGVGYLEQIHVFVSAPVDPNSPLLPELGRLFSPFSSILFTESSSYHLAVSKDDGNIWKFSEFIYSTASKFADGGSTSKMPLVVVSLAQTPNNPAGFSQGGSGSGEGEKNEKQRSEKGKERDREDEDEADKGDGNDEDPPDDPGKPPENKATARLPEISFETGSKVYLNQDEQNAFQTLTMQGSLTIKTTTPVQRRQFSTRDVRFTALTFGTEPTTDIAYKQLHVRVVVNSQQETARIEGVIPKRSLDSDGKEKQSSLKKKGQNYGVTATATLVPHPQLAATGSAMKTNEETTGSQKMRYTSRITEHHSDGIVRWGFHVDDIHLRERGIDMPDDVLPTVHFKFLGDSDEPAPPPECMDIVIASHWSMILPIEQKSSWIRRYLRLFSGNPRAISYSNLFQIVALKTVPSNLPELSHYKATLEVEPGAPDPPTPEVIRRTAGSVVVTPAVVDDLNKLNDLGIARFELSDKCIPTLKVDNDIKSH